MSPAELNRLVAEKVMGWQVSFFENINTWEFISEDEIIDQNDFQPSTDIEQAWSVVDKLAYDVKLTKYHDLKPKYQVHVFIPDNVQMVFADTPPMAICLAALKTVRMEVKIC